MITRRGSLGTVKGRVVTKAGNPVANATVRGWIPGLLTGGSVQTTTDPDGRFVLSYSGVGRLDYVSVDGGEREEKVASGSTLTLYR